MSENVILMGDIHFGVKKFNLKVLEDQINVFTKQIFPYMEENGITEIYQLGDILDNRTTADIIWFETLKKTFFQELVDRGYVMNTLLGNHDIAYRESREVSLITTLSELYPENFKIFTERQYIKVCEKDIYVVPWMTKNETLLKEELMNADYVFGHFEVRDFYMVPGHKDTKSKLTEEFFEGIPKLKNVFSGHYHLRNTKGFLKYLGSLTQINWSDYNDMKGFYDFDGEELVFIENITSKKHIKIKYNDEEYSHKNIEIKGLYTNPIFLDKKEFEDILPDLKKHEIKTYINKHKDNSYEEVITKMKNHDIKGPIINNQELSELINLDQDIELEHKDSKTLIIEVFNNMRPDLMPLVTNLFNELDTKGKI